MRMHSLWQRSKRVTVDAGVSVAAPPRVAPVTDHRDPFEVKRQLLAGRRVSTIFDVGANTGQTAENYARCFPDAAVYSFEPFEQSFRRLRQNVEGMPKVQPFHMAVAETNGHIDLFVNQNCVTNSLFPTAREAGDWCDSDASQIEGLGKVSVPVTTIDQFCAQRGIGHIDVLKMDIQGGELRALAGAEKMLRQRAVSLIFSEVIFVPFYTGQARFDQLAALLHQYGYSLFDFYHQRHAENGRLKWCDALFISPEFEAAPPRGAG
jgi:FkbM family methyltransferase